MKKKLFKPATPEQIASRIFESEVELRDNNCCVRELCPICGSTFHPAVGPILFLKSTWHPVCDKCGKKEDPELYKLMVFAQREMQMEYDMQNVDGEEIRWIVPYE